MSDSEKIIMEIIWDSKIPLSAAEIRNAPACINWNVSTIWTMIKRLVKKGYILPEKTDRVRYYVKISREEYAIKESRDLLNKLYKGSLFNFIAAFSTCGNSADKDELAEIRRMLEDNQDTNS